MLSLYCSFQIHKATIDMDETYITGILIEPDWYVVYVDGEHYMEGHSYDDTMLLEDAVNRSDKSCHIVRTQTNVEGPWQGVPDTLHELVDDEQFDISEDILGPLDQ